MVQLDSSPTLHSYVVYDNISHPSGGVSKRGATVYGTESNGTITLSCCGRSFHLMDDNGNQRLVYTGNKTISYKKQSRCPLKQYFPTEIGMISNSKVSMADEVGDDILNAFKRQLSYSCLNPDQSSDATIEESFVIFNKITQLDSSSDEATAFKVKLQTIRSEHIESKKKFMKNKITTWRTTVHAMRTAINALLREPVAAAAVNRVFSDIAQYTSSHDDEMVIPTSVKTRKSLRVFGHKKIVKEQPTVLTNKVEISKSPDEYLPRQITSCLGMKSLAINKQSFSSFKNAGVGGVATAITPPPSQGAVAGISPCIGVSAAVLGGLSSLRINIKKSESLLVVSPTDHHTMWATVIKPSLTEASIAAITATSVTKAINLIPHHHKQNVGTAAATSFALCSAIQAAYNWNRSTLTTSDLSKMIAKAVLGISLSCIPKPIGTTITVAAMSSDLVGWTDAVMDFTFGSSSWELRCSLIRCYASIIGVSSRCSNEDVLEAYKELRLLISPSSEWGGTHDDSEILDAALFEIISLRSTESNPAEVVR